MEDMGVLGLTCAPANPVKFATTPAATGEVVLLSPIRPAGGLHRAWLAGAIVLPHNLP